MQMQFSAFVAASLLLLSGCKKDADLLECNLPVKPTKNPASFTTEYSIATQTFSFDATQLQTLTTSAGASVRVPANTFQLPSGVPVSGTIELRVREIYTPGEMVLADMPTVAWSGSFLESDGEIRLTAWQNNALLRLRKGSALIVSTPVPAVNQSSPNTATPMSLRTLTDSGNTRSWIPDSTRILTSTLTPQQPLYRFPVWRDSLGWYNVDRLWQLSPSSPRTTVKISTGAQTTTTRVYLVCRPRNATLPVYLNNQEWTLSGVPEGLEFTTVVLQLRDDQLYYGSQRAVVSASFRFALALEALNPEEIARRIRLL